MQMQLSPASSPLLAQVEQLLDQLVALHGDGHDAARQQRPAGQRHDQHLADRGKRGEEV